jgi:hypothetical protein
MAGFSKQVNQAIAMIELIGKFLNLQERGYGPALPPFSQLLRWLPTAAQQIEGEPVVFEQRGYRPAFIAVPAILFALLVTAFATDVWQKHTSARSTVIREAAALRSLLHVSQQLGEQGVLLEKSAEGYMKAVIDEEWPAMIEADHANKEAAFAALQSLDATVSRIASNSGLSQFTVQRLRTALDTIQVSRLQRISLAHDAISIAKWASAMVLAVLNLLTIAIVHVRRPRAMAISLVLTILCVMATVHVLSNNRSPFVGTAAISDSMLVESLKVFEKR